MIVQDPKVKSEVIERLVQIADDLSGLLKPSKVVEDAREPTSPLHPLFDWNDSSAAHTARLDTARRLIRSVRVEITYRKQITVVPAYLRDPSQDTKDEGYASLDIIMGDVEMRRGTMAAEINRAIASIKRASGIGKALGYDTAVIDRMANRLDEFVSQL